MHKLTKTMAHHCEWRDAGESNPAIGASLVKPMFLSSQMGRTLYPSLKPYYFIERMGALAGQGKSLSDAPGRGLREIASAIQQDVCLVNLKHTINYAHITALTGGLWSSERDSNPHNILPTYSIYRSDVALPLCYPMVWEGQTPCILIPKRF